LLHFLYAARWQELKQLGQTGLLAQEILVWLKKEQFANRKTTTKQLLQWVQERGKDGQLSAALTLLHERFLIINSDPQKGNYAIFPSLSEFLQDRR
jgi:hypothetical protein